LQTVDSENSSFVLVLDHFYKDAEHMCICTNLQTPTRKTLYE